MALAASTAIRKVAIQGDSNISLILTTNSTAGCGGGILHRISPEDIEANICLKFLDLAANVWLPDDSAVPGGSCGSAALGRQPTRIAAF